MFALTVNSDTVYSNNILLLGFINVKWLLNTSELSTVKINITMRTKKQIWTEGYQVLRRIRWFRHYFTCWPLTVSAPSTDYYKPDKFCCNVQNKRFVKVVTKSADIPRTQSTCRLYLTYVYEKVGSSRLQIASVISYWRAELVTDIEPTGVAYLDWSHPRVWFHLVKSFSAVKGFSRRPTDWFNLRGLVLATDHETKRILAKLCILSKHCTFVAAGTENRYGLNVWRSNLGGSDIFSDPPRSARRPEPASCTIGTGSLSRGKVTVGMALTAPPPTSAEIKEKVELYL